MASARLQRSTGHDAAIPLAWDSESTGNRRERRFADHTKYPGRMIQRTSGLLHLAVLTAVFVMLVAGLPSRVLAAEYGPHPPAFTPPFPLVYPIDAPPQFADTFGAARSGGERLHEGGDLFAPKMAPVLATAPGQITAVDWSATGGFYIEVTHDGGWRSRYLHLNNDTPGTDDGLGFGIAEGVIVGAQVAAGQVIGYVGDSGNAESSSAHLHFELRLPDWTAVNPHPFLSGRSSETTLYVLPEINPDPITSGVEVLGHIDPAEGFNGDVWAHRDVAYLGTIGMNETCPAIGVRVYDVVDPSEPAELGIIAGEYEGTSTQQVWVGSVDTERFVGDLGVVAHRVCDGHTPETFRGLTMYDVTDPSRPVALGSYGTGSGTLGVQGFDVWVEQDRVVVVAAVPDPMPDQLSGLGHVRVVDISDPTAPEDIADWDFRRDTDQSDRDAAMDGTDPLDVHANGVTLDPDGRRAFVSLWDAGVVVLDLSTIERPQAVGWTRSLGYAQGNSGSTSFSPELETLVVNHENLDPLDDGESGNSQSWGKQAVFAVGENNTLAFVASYSVEDALPNEDGVVSLNGIYSAGDSLAAGRHVYSAWLAGGLRVVDFSDPFEPTEVASFVPPAEIDPYDRFVSPNGVIKLPLAWAVDVDGGEIYVSDLNTGLWILRLIDAPQNAE